ncbi:hypothetical protein Nepgr_012946 [Nepenthes gracilis]|uniref:Uncharacterized protein n=1 Tax=Nepenthes gracilis TaxID=150966 RepID=A0AAD3SGM5_NEPGR|nr:hypothetical protein Nepgr_012946 [Nepenthes gracilis]
MLSMALQASVSAFVKSCLNPSSKLIVQPFKVSTFANSKGFLSTSQSTTRLKYSSRSARSPGLSISAAADSVTDESVEVSANIDDDLAAGKEDYHPIPLLKEV